MLRILLVAIFALPALGGGLDRKTARTIEAFGVKWWKARPANKFKSWDAAQRKALLAEAAAIEIPEGSWLAVRDLLWKSLRKNGPKGKGRDKLFLDSPYKQKMWSYVSAARGKNIPCSHHLTPAPTGFSMCLCTRPGQL